MNNIISDHNQILQNNQRVTQYDTNIVHECPEGRVVVKQMQFPIQVNNPDSKVHGSIMGPNWVLSALDGPHVGPMNFPIKECTRRHVHCLSHILISDCLNYHDYSSVVVNGKFEQ